MVEGGGGAVCADVVIAGVVDKPGKSAEGSGGVAVAAAGAAAPGPDAGVGVFESNPRCFNMASSADGFVVRAGAAAAGAAAAAAGAVGICGIVDDGGVARTGGTPAAAVVAATGGGITAAVGGGGIGRGSEAVCGVVGVADLALVPASSAARAPPAP